MNNLLPPFFIASWVPSRHQAYLLYYQVNIKIFFWSQSTSVNVLLFSLSTHVDIKQNSRLCLFFFGQGASGKIAASTL